MEVVPLLERETQLASLGKYAAEARQGEGRLVLLAGEAGVGKSALVEEVQRSLPRAAWCRRQPVLCQSGRARTLCPTGPRPPHCPSPRW